MERADIGLAGYGGCAICAGVCTYMMMPGMWNIAGAMVCAGVSTIALHFMKQDKMETLWKNCKLCIGEMRPEIQEQRETEYSTIYRYSCPVGLSLEDFKRKQPSIEKFLGKRVKLSDVPKGILLEVYKQNIASVDYELVDTKGALEFPIGITRGGKIKTCDLSVGEPHLLIAGISGGGKSVALRGIVTYLILKKPVRLMLVDLKGGAELGIFRRCSKVDEFARTPQQAYALLCRVLSEVDRRYDLFFESGVTGIEKYNQKFRRLDYQVVVIDEFAEISDDKKTISVLESIAARSRACGIQLILATQRPDAKTVTGKIKCNIGSILGLKTTDDVNSRILIDESGCESLMGNGHGLFKKGTITEVQTMYLREEKAIELIRHTYVDKKKEQPQLGGTVKDFDFLK